MVSGIPGAQGTGATLSRPRGVMGFALRQWYALAVVALIALGVGARLALVLAGWPHTNSEEGSMGLEALHIALRGARPIYYYGQNYMGVGEAYLGALAFLVFGPSVVALRLGMVALYAGFMLGVAWLARLLYSRRVALVALAVLIAGTPFTVRIQLLADGGKAETLAFGALMMALAAWLALTAPGATARWRRWAALAAWGLLAGLGLYTYAIVAPFVLASGLLIGLACWRELRGWLLFAPLGGLLVGLLPAILYTITSPLSQNPVAVFLSLHQSLNAHSETGLGLLIKQFDATLLFTLPQVTGLPAQYPLSALPLYGPPSGTMVCAVVLGGGWSAAYLGLLGVATWRAGRGLTPRPTLPAGRGGDALGRVRGWGAGVVGQMAAGEVEARELAQLALALAGWLTLAAYLFSATAANNPYSGRYLIGLLIVTPALLWPLLERRPAAKATSTGLAATKPAFAGWVAGGKIALLGLLAISLVWDTVGVVQNIPNAVAANGRDATLAHDLLDHGVTRFYADYWTCDVLTFETQERLVCGVVNNYAKPGLTRYAPYFAMVRADPAAPYVFARGSEVERTFLIEAAQTHTHYTNSVIDGHDVYTPVAA